jgi:hypothetical protein
MQLTLLYYDTEADLQVRTVRAKVKPHVDEGPQVPKLTKNKDEFSGPLFKSAEINKRCHTDEEKCFIFTSIHIINQK